MSSPNRQAERIYYWALVIGAVLIPSGVFLILGDAAAKSITSQNQGQVANVMVGFLTVDGLLIGFGSRLRKDFKSEKKGLRIANAFEALQISILTLSLVWSLVTMLYASFSNDISLVSLWFRTSIGSFYLAVALYSSFAILSRAPMKPTRNNQTRTSPEYS